MEQLQQIFKEVLAEKELLEKENTHFKSLIEEQKEVFYCYLGFAY